jgi:methylated-DNA-[protein]-cysteine S-methyltransferase
LLPERDEATLRARLAERLARVEPEARSQRQAPLTGPARAAVSAIAALLEGRAVDLTSLPLDLRAVSPFYQAVYAEARRVVVGQTCTYGQLAARLGKPGAARAVGQALGRNPIALIVPCHRVLAAGGELGGFTAAGGTGTKQRLLEIERRSTSALQSTGRHDLPFDAELAVSTLKQKDPKLGRLIDAVGPFAMQLTATRDLFGALAESIVYQQLTGKAAATIHARLCASLGAEGLTADGVAKVSVEQLRAVGVSRAKALALGDLSRRVLERQLPTLEELTQATDEQVIEQLTRVRGVGRWTAQMFLMFRLGRPDVLPVLDYGVRKGYGLVFSKGKLPEPSQLLARGLRWRPYRTVASWYLWRAVDLDRLKAED